MIVDAHNHIGHRKGLDFPVEQLIEQMDAAGIDKAVVFSFPEEINNDYVADSVRRFPDRLIGFGLVNPWEKKAEDELRRCVENLGLRGLKLHPSRHGFAFDNHTLLDPILSICGTLNIPVIAHGSADILCGPNMFEEMANAFPHVTFIMAHSGQMYEARAGIGVGKRSRNVYLETSTVFARNIAAQLKQVGAEKIIMGTDSPRGDFTLELEKIDAVVPDEAQRALIKGGNLMRILSSAGVKRGDH